MEPSTKENPQEPVHIARWETQGNNYLDLLQHNFKNPEGLIYYSYKGNGCGGGFFASSNEDAIARMEAPWGDPKGAGQATILKTGRKNIKRILLSPAYPP